MYTLTLLTGEYAICRLSADAPVPAWADLRDGFCAIVRTPAELSVLTLATRVPEGGTVARGWYGFEVLGPFPFDTVGVLARLSGALADAGISLLALSSFDTDYLFVREADVDRAVDAWRSRGHVVHR